MSDLQFSEPSESEMPSRPTPLRPNPSRPTLATSEPSQEAEKSQVRIGPVGIGPVGIGPVVQETEARWLLSYERWKEQQKSERKRISEVALSKGYLSLILGVALLIGLFAIIAFEVGFDSPNAVPLAMVVFGLLNLTAARFLWWGEKGFLARLRERFEMVDEAEALPDQWLVQITITQDGAVAGTDIGTLWFEDRRLLFSGENTSFALGAGDLDFSVHRRLRKFKSIEPYIGTFHLPLDRSKGQVAQAINIRVSRGVQQSLNWLHSNDPNGYDANLHTKLLEFASQGPGIDESTWYGQRPPTGIGPGYRPARLEAAQIVGRTLFGFLVSALVGFVLGLLFFSMLGAAGWLFGLAVWFGMLAYFWPQVSTVARAYIGASRLWRQHRAQIGVGLPVGPSPTARVAGSADGGGP